MNDELSFGVLVFGFGFGLVRELLLEPAGVVRVEESIGAVDCVIVLGTVTKLSRVFCRVCNNSASDITTDDGEFKFNTSTQSVWDDEPEAWDESP